MTESTIYLRLNTGASPAARVLLLLLLFGYLKNMLPLNFANSCCTPFVINKHQRNQNALREM